MARRGKGADEELAEYKRSQIGESLPAVSQPKKNANAAPDRSSGQPDAIPPHVWETLQNAGEEAARRLYDLLRSPRFANYSPSAQARLIELGLTRAYGLPVRRSIDLKLTSDDADAVAQSLIDLGASLPERKSMIDVNLAVDSHSQKDVN